MNTETAPVELDVLTDEEMARVVGGAAKTADAQAWVYEKIGMCGCGLRH